MEGQAEGVMQDGGAPQADVSGSSPEPVESGSHDNGNSHESQGQSGSSDQQKSKDYNFRQMRENLSRLEAERKQWQSERETLQGAAAIDQMLRADPRAGLKQIAQQLGIDIKTLLDAQPQTPKIDYSQYDPETASLLKYLDEKASKVDALEQWKNQFEQKSELTQRQQQEQFVQQNVKNLENRFFEDLVKDGFLDKNGKGNMEVVDLIKDAILSKLAQQVDPRLATIEQYQTARTQVLKGLSAHKSKTLQNTVTQSVPSTGSKNGAATTANPVMSREGRIAALAQAAKANTTWGFE